MSTNGSIPKQSYLLIISILAIFILFFIEGPTTYSNRIYKLFWDNGHIIFFALVGWFIFNYTSHKPRYFTYLSTLLICLTLGCVIEAIQYNIERSANWQDVYRGILGGTFSSLILHHKKSTTKSIPLIVAIAIISILIIREQKQLFIAIKLELAIYENFPILSKFDQPNDLLSWSGNSLVLANSQAQTSRSSLKAEFRAHEKYSNVTLEHFYHDWRGYQSLHITLQPADDKPIELCIRITDFVHDIGEQSYSDRYNKCINITKGLNNIIISLKEIEQAPLQRKMALNKVNKITFFSRQLTDNRYIYISSIYLSK